jgi:type IV pilus assembly protein PilO
MDLSQLNELDFNNTGEWPLPAKIGAVIIVGIVVLGLAYYFDTQYQIETLLQVENKEKEKRKEFEDKNQKASKLEAYTQQLTEMEDSFKSMLKQLPDKTEVASLLVEVTQTGLGNGLEFELFKPGSEVPKDFYAELPINIKVVGTFHNFGSFVSGIAALPRIVTVHDIVITPKNITKKSAISEKAIQLLTLEATAKTYKYLESGTNK